MNRRSFIASLGAALAAVAVPAAAAKQIHIWDATATPNPKYPIDILATPRPSGSAYEIGEWVSTNEYGNVLAYDKSDASEIDSFVSQLLSDARKVVPPGHDIHILHNGNSNGPFDRFNQVAWYYPGERKTLPNAAELIRTVRL